MLEIIQWIILIVLMISPVWILGIIGSILDFRSTNRYAEIYGLPYRHNWLYIIFFSIFWFWRLSPSLAIKITSFK